MTEEMLYVNAPSAKFALINNYDWAQKQEVDHGQFVNAYAALTSDQLRSLAEAEHHVAPDNATDPA